MATIEKLIKAFEALKVFQPAVASVEEVVKKKDQPLSKKEKMINCNLIADCICSPSMRTVGDFPKFLGIAMETFLTLTEDPESDIRMVVDECLNRSIKALLETNLGRLQVELYKEIKKNGSPRCLRAALWRFAEMAHLIKPQKCRPYIVNLLPCLVRICKREDEGIQETLLQAMNKIAPALVGYGNDSEIKILLKAFIPNLKSTMASCRRTAATSLTLICQYSRSPPTFFYFLLVNLLDVVLPVDTDIDKSTLVGVILCIRNILPQLINDSKHAEGLRGSFGETKQKKEEKLTAEQALTVYQFLLYNTGHSDHNVVTAALEALQQLLRTPPANLREVLVSDGGIQHTYIFQKDMQTLKKADGLIEVPSASQLSVTSLDTGLDEESESCDIKSQSGASVTSSSAYGSELDPSAVLRTEEPDKDSLIEDTDVDGDDGLLFEADLQNATEYSNIEIGDIQEDKSEKSEKSESNLTDMNIGSQETLLSIKSLSPSHQVDGRLEIGQDMNGNPELIEAETQEPMSPLLDTTESDISTAIGSMTDGHPLLYFIRLITRRFLLTSMKDVLTPDRKVRVSIKSLALSNIGSAMCLCPWILLQPAFKTEVEGFGSPPLIRDVLLYSSHQDPQLRGAACIIVGNFLSQVLPAGNGDFYNWLQAQGIPNQGSFTLDKLIEIILSLTEDSSSFAARIGISALGACMGPLLQSVHGDIALTTLLKLLQVKDNAYWLAKVELLDVIQKLDFKIVFHLEQVCTPAIKKHVYLGNMSLQEHIVEEIVIQYLDDEDSRVRSSAAQTLVRLVDQLFYSLDYTHQDPVIAITKNCTDRFLSPIMHDWCQAPPPPVQGLVKPYHVTPRLCIKPSVESCLSRLVMVLLNKLNLAQTKHTISGCCHAMYVLSEEYLTSCHSQAWGCGAPSPLIPKESAGRYRRPPTRSLSGSSTFSLDELTSGSGGGPLPTILSLLTSTPVTLDLTTHQYALQLAGNLIAGSAFNCLRSQELDTNRAENQSDETSWPALSNRVLVPLIDQLLTHVARVLNAFAHVIDEQQPGPPQMKTALPSLPTAPSLSPIKRKAKGEKEAGSNPATPTQDGKTSQKASQKDKDSEKEKSRKEGLGTFYTYPHYVKFYEVLKGAYSSFKTSLELSSADKFCSMLKTCLTVFSQILEVATLQDTGKYADEFLNYLRTTATLKPADTVLCVQQLLKSLFGTNLCSQWEEHQVNLSNRRPGKGARLSGNRDGLYQCTFTLPYSQFTQTLAASTIKAVSPDHEDTSGVLSWLKKSVERKVPAILKPSSKADKTAIASYIRLFEPLVIKALKQYTVTSSLSLQQQVLDLLSQLVQLRVNYCLLDSDQVFIGFVIKQFEFIEEGQIRNSEILIPNIFNFLVMLSYEKFHSKPVITMPKIIQLCDGIMASGQHPTTHAIPALQPIVYDLFLLRGANKSDISKDLETQREVIVSMLLRLTQYHQAIDMFVVILQQCHRESEERWKRLSRQVTDTILPALTKLQVNLDSQVALDVVHRLFESVAPIVFRPVDILLKTLLMRPADVSSVIGLERWNCVVLAVLRVLMAQSKEEVVLSRINELGLKLQLFRSQDRELSDDEKEVVNGLSPEEVMARFFLQTIGKIGATLTDMRPEYNSGSSIFLCQQISHLLMYITHMFQSGSFRRVATASIQAINQPRLGCFYDVQEINSYFMDIGVFQPTLTLQWCNVLILLNFSDQAFWSGVMKTPKKYIMASSSGESTCSSQSLDSESERRQQCTNQEVLRRGGLVLFCDYACENLNDSEHMTWVIINHVRDLIELCEESPVQDFISAIHRNSAASSLFIQAIHARWADVTPPSVVKKALKCLDAIHFSQSGALLTLLIDKFLNTHHLAVARSCDSIACRRVEMLLAESPQEKMKQLPLDDLDKLLTFISTNKLNKKHARLLSLLNKFRDMITDNKKGPVSVEGSHPLKQLSPGSIETQMDKEFYMAMVKDECFCLAPNIRECANLLQYMEYSDILSILMAKEFHLSILGECMSLGGLKTLQRYSRDVDISAEQTHQLEWTLDPLFQASQLTLMRHINNVINQLPVPHQVVNFSDVSRVKSARYYEKLEDFFSDSSSVEILFHLVVSLVEYLVCLSVFPWKPKVPLESQSDVCRFCVFSMECINWMLCQNQLPTTEQLHTNLKFVSLVLNSQQLSSMIGQKDHVTWVCSLTNSVREIVSALCVLPGQQLCVHTRTDDNPSHNDDLHHLTEACDAISDLVQFIFSTRNSSMRNMEVVLPRSLSSLVNNVVIGLSRMPVLNSYARMPPVVWKMGWIPATSGDSNTKLPPLPIDLMMDQDVLKEFIRRINSIGWISRQQFEETWMSLLGMLNPVSTEEEIAREEDIERTHCMVLTVRAITGMLMQTMIVPSPGDPVHGLFDVQPRDKPLGFLHTRCGKKLTVIRGVVEHEVQSLSSARNVNNKGTDTYKFDYNLEREVAVDTYTLGQVSVESIWSVVGVLDPVHSESDTTDSLDSPSHTPLVTMATSPGEAIIQRDPSVSVAGLDVHSCLQFLLDFYRQWLLPGNNGKPPLMLLNEVIKSSSAALLDFFRDVRKSALLLLIEVMKSVVSLSDLFAEREQFDWMLDTMFEVYKAHPGEDEMALQYLNVGICKAAAVVGVDNTTADRLIKIIDNGYKSTHLPSKTATLHGTLYLLEAGIHEVTKQLVPLTTEFILKNMTLASRLSVCSEKYVLTMWATAFYILENYSSDVKDTEFPQQTLQMAISMASSSEDSVSVSVYLTILKGLERLLLTDVLVPSDAEMIVKLSVDRLCLPSPQRSLAALGLLFTCMYSGKQYDGYSPRPREHDTFNMEDLTQIYQDPESLIVAMERVTVLFDRIKKGYPYEARVIARVMPSFLADFFPPQDIMNKVIGEFLSSQQPYPQLIAKVVFQVFSILHEQRQHGLLKDWVMLSLSNFTQRTPVAMAMWSLTCFFISASVNPWLRNLLSYVLSRMGKIEASDKKLFCMAALDFYSQLTDDSQRRAFHSTFQTVRSNHPDSPYSDLLNILVKPPN